MALHWRTQVRVATLAVALIARPVGLAGQTAPMALPRLAGPVTIDGVPNDPAWQTIPALPLTTYAPVFRAPPTQRTEIRVAYDDDYFYAGGWFYDTDPAGIRINSLYRDRWNGDDAFAIYIDGFNDNQNAKWFGTTAGGIRFDVLLSDDGATSNDGWDTFWTARTTVTDQGWFAEVRIPLSSIGFKPGPDGAVVMGLTVTRLISRSGERVTFPEIDPKFEFRRPSLARDVLLTGLKPRTPVYVTPYLLGGATRSVAAATPGYPTGTATSREAGLDVRYPVSSQLTLDLTANTDFAQVEADDQQVNLDRFPLYYPERRRFFQEGSGIFDFTGVGGSRLFNSRRIGLGADLTPVRILGGGRLVGRSGPWDVGLLAMQTDREGASPAEHFDVVRLRRQVLNPYSTAGLLLTSYFGGGRRNTALGLDGAFRVTGDHYLTLKWAATDDSRNDPAGASLLDRSQLDLKWERRTGRGLQYVANLARSGSAFLPELGFEPRQDFTTANVVGNYFIFTDRSSWLRRVYPGALAFQTWRNGDGALESAQYAVWVEWDTKAGGGGWIEPKVFHENVLAAFPVGSATIPAGAYTFADLQLVFFMPAGARFRTSVDARAGTYFDGTRKQVIVSPTWNVSPHLELSGDYQATFLRFRDRGQRTDIHLARLRIRAALDARASGNAFVQYNSTTNRLDLNVRLRYAFREGTDLWLVYNEGLDTDRVSGPDGVAPPLSLNRALIAKLTYTLGSH